MVASGVGPAVRRLNGEWHRRALIVFMAIVLAHWAEHILQAFQMYALGWAPESAGGGLGLLFPSLVTSEWLHYVYNFAVLAGLALLLPGFRGSARIWWMAAAAIQFWHHLEHALLLGQATLDKNLFGADVPTSVLQLFFPRAELHLAYNAIVLAPLLIGFYLHRHPRSPVEKDGPGCSCEEILDWSAPPICTPGRAPA